MRIGRAVQGSVIAAVVALAVVGCGRAELPESIPNPVAASDAAAPTSESPATTQPATSAITFRSVVDGDTIETSAGTVRIIGIDTAERGECGYEQGSAAIADVLKSGDPVTLELPRGQNDRDKHARLLRYVSTAAGLDLGLVQLKTGNAVARYDSRDGYPTHPREAAYHAAQIASLGADGAVITTGCKSAAAPAPSTAADAPAAPANPAPADAWWTKYSSCGKVKKNTAGDPRGPFRRNNPAEAQIYDWFEHGTGNNGDGDDDGIACE